MRRYFSTYSAKAGRHPSMLVSPVCLKATAARLFGAEEPLLVKAHRKVVANSRPKPASTDIGPARLQAQATLNAAYLAALRRANGDDRTAATFASRAKEALLAFAQLGAPDADAAYGALVQMYLVSLAFAYDLAWNVVDWTSGERELLRDFFYSHRKSLLHTMHSKHMSNHAAWPMCRLSTTALLFGDDGLAAECLDGPDSYVERLAHEFFDDGMSYEQSAWAYQCFSLEPVLFTALAARGAGVRPDPLRVRVKNNKSLTFLGGSTGDFRMPFYPADTSLFPRPKEKNLRMALTAQFQLLRGDTTCPSIGDYGGPTPPMADHWVPEMAWNLYGDRAAARILSAGSRKASGSSLFADSLLTLAFGKPLPEKVRYASKSTVYPQAGYAVLKSVEGDAFWGSQAIHAVLKFGPYGNGHGHADKLHLDLSGSGRKTCTEELEREVNDWKYWNSTVSHNSVVVDGKSQAGNEEMFALNDSCGRLLLSGLGPRIKVACADAPGIYPRVATYRRTVAVTDCYAVDVFEVKASKRVTCDWFLHGRGALEVENATMRRGSLGYKSEGYEFLRSVHRVETGGPAVARFAEGHKLFLPVADGLEVFAATGPWKTGARRPVLVARASGKEALFAAVHDPSGRLVRAVKATAAAGAVISLEVVGSGFVDTFKLVKTPRKRGGDRKKTSQAPFHVIYFRKRR